MFDVNVNQYHPWPSCNDEDPRQDDNSRYLRGRLERSCPLPGIVMDVNDNICYQPLTWNIDPPDQNTEGVLVIRFSLQGEFEFLKCGQRLRHSNTATCLLIYLPKKESISVLQRPDVGNVGVTFYMSCDAFFRTFGQNLRNCGFLGNIGSGKVNRIFFDQPPLTSVMVQAVRDILSCSFKGCLQEQFFRAKAVELLCRYIELYSEKGPVSMLARSIDDSNDRGQTEEWLDRVQQLLERRHTSPPSIEELSRITGRGDNKLKEEFKRRFGVSIGQYCKNIRLEKAMQLLLGSTRSVSVVANEVGYAHASSFVHAFSSHFGVTPHRVRKGL